MINYYRLLISDYWQLLVIIDDYWRLLAVIDNYWLLLTINNSSLNIADSKCDSYNWIDSLLSFLIFNNANK